MKINRKIQFHNEWFLLLSPAFLIIRGFARFPEAIHWSDIVFLFLEYGCWSVLITVTLSFFLSFRKAALWVFVLVLFNWIYSSLYEYSVATGHAYFYTRFRFVFPSVIIAFLVLLYFLKKTLRSFNKTTRFLNFLFMVLIAIEVGQVTIKLLKQNKNEIAASSCDSCRTPDVYLLITDGYAGKKQLVEQFKYDNTAFEDSLKRLGFFVVDSSISNYGSTAASMASLLNMNYTTIGADDDVHALLSNSRVVKFFKKMDYQLVNHSIFKIGNEFPKQPTAYFKTGTVIITHHSFFSHLKLVVHNLLADAELETEKKRVQRIQRQVNRNESGRDSLTMQYLLATVTEKDAVPKFVYAHFIMPHPPYLFDRNGNELNAGPPEEKYIPWPRSRFCSVLKA